MKFPAVEWSIMMKETKYSVLPVYACALVWVLWALVIHFGAVWTYIVCALISAAAYGGLRAAFPPVERNAIPAKVTAAADWAALSNQFGEYAAVFQNSMLEAPLPAAQHQYCKNQSADPAESGAWQQVRAAPSEKELLGTCWRAAETLPAVPSEPQSGGCRD